MEETEPRKKLKTGIPWADWYFRNTFLDLTRRMVRGKTLAGSHRDAIHLASFSLYLPLPGPAP